MFNGRENFMICSFCGLKHRQESDAVCSNAKLKTSFLFDNGKEPWFAMKATWPTEKHDLSIKPNFTSSFDKKFSEDLKKYMNEISYTYYYNHNNGKPKSQSRFSQKKARG